MRRWPVLGLIVAGWLTGCGGGSGGGNASPPPEVPSTLVTPTATNVVVDANGRGQYLKGIALIGLDTPSSAEAVAVAETVGGRVIGSVEQIGLYQVEMAGLTGVELDSRIATLAADRRTTFATRDMIAENLELTTRAWPNDIAYEPSADGAHSRRWHWERIDAPQAWDIVRGSRENSRIGVIDIGFDMAHPDLAANVLSFSRQGIEPRDERGYRVEHGNHVAGLLGAVGGNGEGVTGLCWQAGLRLFECAGWPYSALAAAIVQACDAGCRVLNLSLGPNYYNKDSHGRRPTFGPGGVADRNSQEVAQALRGAVLYAQRREVLLVQAAGNDSNARNTNDTWALGDVEARFNLLGALATEFDNVLTVAACVDSDSAEKARYSNSGSVVRVCAPGGDGRTEVYSLLRADGLGAGGGLQYGPKFGTSMAAPIVSGLAGLLLAIEPNMTVTQMVEAIIGGAEEGGRFYRDPVDGHRVYRVNALRSVLRVRGEPFVVADLQVRPASAELGSEGTLVEFDARGSIAYGINLGRVTVDPGDGSGEQPLPSANLLTAVKEHTYRQAGRFEVVLRLWDTTEHIVAEARRTVTIGVGSINITID